MNKQDYQSKNQSQWTSISLFWDGIYNVDKFGTLIAPPISPIDGKLVCYNCTKYWLKRHSKNWKRGKQRASTVDSDTLAIKIGHNAGVLSSGVAVNFTPYEQMLVIPIQIYKIEKVKTLMLRIYRCDRSGIGDEQSNSVLYRVGKSNNCLVYQEILNESEFRCLQMVDSFLLEETHSDFSNRIRNYWGVEDFANWYHHTYSLELWASINPTAFVECNGVRHPEPKVGQTVHSRMMCETGSLGWTNRNRRGKEYCQKQPKAVECIVKIAENFKNDEVTAHDELNYNYNFERSKSYFKLLSDFSRIQRLLRNKRVFFANLQHIEDYLEARPNAELLEALEFFEDQARFPTLQAIPIGVLPSPCFSELVTRAYAIYDVGVRSCHGGFTHRLQWHGIIRLMTNGHTVAIAKGFYHSALELYCAARSSLFNTTNRPNAEFTIDLWRFLFDRFDKYATSDSPKSAQFVQYPERYEDELHYAEQFHMATLDLPQDVQVTQRYIMELSSWDGKLTPTSLSISKLLNGDSIIPSKLHNWIERYIDHLTLSLGSDYTGATADARLAWGCLIGADEWGEIDAEFESRRIHFHNLTRTASKLRSFFVEAVLAVRVISELRCAPNLLPYGNPYRQAILTPTSTERPLSNVLEEIAPYARILRLLNRSSNNGELLFSRMTDADGNPIECLKRTEAVQLSQQMLDTLKLESRISLKQAQNGCWTITGIAFP